MTSFEGMIFTSIIRYSKNYKIKMNRYILISAIGFFLAIGLANAKELSNEPETAAIQKLEQLATKQMQTGVSSKEPLLKARILETRALFLNVELDQDQWLAKEKKFNTELLFLQSHSVSRRRYTVDDVFAFQNSLLSTRELLKRKAVSGQSHSKKPSR
jgi:hypothetical protein